MIRVDRSLVPVPESLTSERAARARARIAKIIESPELREQTRIEFLPELWEAARRSLFELFHEKCAFCESGLSPKRVTVVHHFRPRQGATDMSGARDHAYYAWLAYEWDNLLISCQECVARIAENPRQGDWFGMRAGTRAPLMSSVEQCREVEQPVLIDPSFEEPSKDIAFELDGRCVAITPRGAINIELHLLDRPDLVRERAATARNVRELCEAWQKSAVYEGDVGPQLLDEIREAISGQQPFTAVARVAFNRFVEEAGWTNTRWLEDNFPSTTGRFAKDVESLRASAPEPAAQAPAPEVAQELAAKAKDAAAAPTKIEGLQTLPPRAMYRITRISIRNFRAIKALDLEIPVKAADNPEAAGALMFLGENAVGKSTVLEAIALALLGTNLISKLKGVTAAAICPWRGHADPMEPTEVLLWFDGVNNPRALYIDPRRPKFRGDAEPATVLLGYGPRRFFVDPSFLRSLLKRDDSPHQRVATLFDPTETITHPGDWLRKLDQKQFDAVIRALKQLLMLDEGAVVQRSAGKGDDSEIMFDMQGGRVPLSHLSEGYRTIVATTVDIMREMLRYWPDLESAQGIVLLDEVETHLHPRWKMRIMRLLRRAMPRVTFIATTHDPLCLRGMNDGEVAVLHRDTRSRISLARDLPRVTGLSVQQLLTSEYFGLFSTEDPRFEAQLASYTALANKADRSESEEQDLSSQREAAMEKLVPGATPEERVVYQAINSLLREHAEEAKHDRQQVNKEAVGKAIDLFRTMMSKEQKRLRPPQ